MSIERAELQDAVRQVVDGVGVSITESQMWSQISELGWLAVAVPESLGGLAAGASGACAVHRELGRGLTSAPYLAAMLAIDMLSESDIADREDWLQRMIGGELVTTSLATGGPVLRDECVSGLAVAVPSADTASYMLVVSAERDLIALARPGPGIEFRHRQTWDRTRRLFDVEFSEVPVASLTVLARDAQAAQLASRLAVYRDFALAAEAVGGAERLLEMTVEHLQTRVQFKRPLAMFQALKHRCADLKTAIAAADAMLFDALARVEGDLARQDAGRRAAGARLLASDTFARVAEEALQLHGGIGMAAEHPCHLYLKRALLTRQLGDYETDSARNIAGDLLRENRAQC